MKIKLIVLLLFVAGTAIKAKQIQLFEEIIPGQYTYTRQDDKVFVLNRWICFPQKAVIIKKETDPELWGGKRYHLHQALWIKDPEHESDAWVYRKAVDYSDFIKFYTQDE